MNLPFSSRADLAILLAKLPREQWERAARAAGFIPRQLNGGVGQDVPDKAGIPGTGQEGGGRSGGNAQPYQPADLPDMPFWRVVSEVREAEPAEHPQHREGVALEALPFSNPLQPRPQQKELLPPARQARLFRRQLAAGRAAPVLFVGAMQFTFPLASP